MKEQTREEPKIVAAAERQMRAWSLAQELSQRAAQTRRVDQPHQGFGPYITVSREAGAGGSQIAELVGQKLGWEVLDRNLLDRVAERFRLCRHMLELVDETQPSFARDVLGAWFDPRIVPHGKYVVCLGRVVEAAARRGRVVLVGRGANLLLPRDQGLAVRLIASESYRVQQIMQRCGLEESQARRYMAEVDRGRREFVLEWFNRDITDPHLFDLVIQVDRLGPAGAADAIIAAYRHWNAGRFAQEPVGAAP